jgi:hypothetical protein
MSKGRGKLHTAKMGLSIVLYDAFTKGGILVSPINNAEGGLS